MITFNKLKKLTDTFHLVTLILTFILKSRFSADTLIVDVNTHVLQSTVIQTEIYRDFSSSRKVRASAETVRDKPNFGNRTLKHFGQVIFNHDIILIYHQK